MRADRREFLKKATRGLLLGLFGFFGVKLVRRAILRSDEICSNDFICNGCGVYRGCGLPQALSAKRARGEG